MQLLSSWTMRRLAGTTVAVLALGVTAGCDDDDDPVEPRRATEIEIVSGTPQSIARNAASQPLIVRVLDQDDDPMAGVNVTFAVATGTGTLSATTATTGANGQAQTVFTAGNTAGTATVTATATGITGPQTFTITITP